MILLLVTFFTELRLIISETASFVSITILNPIGSSNLKIAVIADPRKSDRISNFPPDD